LTRVGCSRSIGSESGSYGCERVKRGGRLNQVRRILIRRRMTRVCGRRRGKADGERLRRRSSLAGPQSRVSGHGLGREWLLCDARELARLAGAAATAERRRGDRTTRRRGFGAAVNSGEPSSATRCTGTTTSDTGELLTSLRSSGTASRRWSGYDGGEQRRRCSRVLVARAGWRLGHGGSRVGRPGAAARFK
jgi:hypothetical protein